MEATGLVAAGVVGLILALVVTGWVLNLADRRNDAEGD